MLLPADTENTLGHAVFLTLRGAVAGQLPQPVTGLGPGRELPQLDGVERLQFRAAPSHDLLQFAILGVVETARPHGGFQADVESVGKIKQPHLEMFPELGVQFLQAVRLEEKVTEHVSKNCYKNPFILTFSRGNF